MHIAHMQAVQLNNQSLSISLLTAHHESMACEEGTASNPLVCGKA